MKKIIALLTAVAMTSSMTMTAMASTFTDVTADNTYSWAYSSVEDLVSKGIVASDTLYNPQNSLTNEQVLAFMGRILGVKEDENANIVSFAKDKYASLLSKYSTYASAEAAFLMYKGLFTESDIKTMLDNKDTVVPRYQAAIDMTKLMGAENTVENQVLVSLDYADTDSIPTTAQGYVQYMKEQNIMLGDTNNNFSPNVTLNRAMMAVILDKVYKKMDRSYTMSKITKVSASTNTVVTLDTDGSEIANTLTSSTKILVDGVSAVVSSLRAGDTVTFTQANGAIIEADVITSSSSSTDNNTSTDSNTNTNTNNSDDENAKTADVIYVSKYDNQGKNYIKTYKMGGSSTDITSYQLSTDVDVIYNGSSTTVAKLPSGCEVNLTIKNGVITKIVATPSAITVDNVTIEDLSYENSTITISSSNSAYDGKTYKVSDTAKVYKNGKIVSMSDISEGDTVSISLSYGVITKLVDSATESQVSGTISSIEISTSPTITLTVDGKKVTYEISNDVTVTSNGETSSVYSLRVGYTVTVTSEGNEATYIKVDNESSTSSITGVIVTVTPSYNYIKLTNSATGASEDIFVSGTAKIMSSDLQTSYKLSELKSGQTIMVYGGIKSGSFVATSILVLS